MRLGIADQKVLRAFSEKKAAEGKKLSTNGRILDGHWMGGGRIAEWTREGVYLPATHGSSAVDNVQRQLRRHLAPADLHPENRPRRTPRTQLYSGIAYGNRLRRDVPTTIANARKAFARIDQILSGVQQIIGEDLSTEQVKAEAPVAFKRASKAFSFIERARRALAGSR
jgi:hypothetical protein